GVLDAADPARERRVVAREVLKQRRERFCPRVLSLVDAEHSVPVGEQPQGEVRADLARGAGDQDAHASSVTRACDGTVWVPRRVIDVASSTSTSTSSPAAAVPTKFDGVLRT